jgi:SAM-dependent methyltransferase
MIRRLAGLDLLRLLAILLVIGRHAPTMPNTKWAIPFTHWQRGGRFGVDLFCGSILMNIFPYRLTRLTRAIRTKIDAARINVGLENVSRKIHPEDTMYVSGHADHYFNVGLSALRIVQQTLKAEPRTILDFPCGYGRVLRFLAAAYPSATIYGAEIKQDALEFCQAAFGTTSIESQSDLTNLNLEQRFDLIWCGSLVPHLNEQSTRNLLSFFKRHLSDNGVCIFTTHGEYVVNRIMSGEYAYGLSPVGQEKLLREYQHIGYGYSDYATQSGYGISAVTPEYMGQLIRVLSFTPRGWDSHQDVYSMNA